MMVDIQRNLGFGRCLALAVAMLGLGLAAYAAPNYKVLHNFTGGTDGNGNTGVIVDFAGNLFAARGARGTAAMARAAA
jgi:hypothetical protein